MFQIIKTDYDAVMNQDICTYQNEEGVSLKIWISKEKKDFLNTRVYGVVITDPQSNVNGMSLGYALDQLSLNIDRPISYPLKDIDDILKNFDRLKGLGKEIMSILEEYK